ncbi:putative DNA polymerase [Halotydeus destructor]|nr:putative DNA polymerase [Halotydeus destructor]
MKGYTNHGRHFCENVCRACARLDCEEGDEFQCDECQMKCRNEKCLDIHVEKRCHKLEYCHECEVRYKPIPDYEHKCDHKYCAQCKMEYTSNHHHYITPLEQEKLIEEDLKNKIIVAYDIEAAQVRLGEKLAIHKANLVICHTVCDKCWDYDTRQALPCTDCVELERVYQGEDCIDQFCDYLINEVSSRAGKESLVDIYAHNAKNYDNRFVLRELLERKMQKHEMIMTGSKITKMMVGNLRFVDSCLHFQQRLANLPGSFNFKDRVVKGYFPHLFNDGTNWLYSGPVPAAHYFGVETMQGDDAKAFLQWHNERSADPSPWVFEDEIIKYCRNDVEILLLALQEYRKQTKAETNLDPTTRKFTLAGVAHEVFRTNMLKKGDIGITPIEGYTARNSSICGNVWLDGEEMRLGRPLEREAGIGPYYADGYDKATKTVYEFWGCLWHGCRCQYEDEDSVRMLGDKKLDGAKLRQKRQDKTDYYGRRGFKLVEIDECKFLDQLYPNSRNVPDDEREYDLDHFEKEIRQHMREQKKEYHRIKSGNLHCNVRESFYGGRTGNAAMYYECKEDEEIKYLDFTSLYPDVLKNREYPLGHPVVRIEDSKGSLMRDVGEERVFGFIQCTLVPPKQMLHGILPVRGSGRLLFPLCALCADTSSLDNCYHSDEERALNGTWASPEVYKAMRLGYQLLRVNEVLHYDRSDDKLFHEYINMWLKIKQEASGWPSWVQKEQARGKTIATEAENGFIERIMNTTGTRLTREEIESGAGWPPYVKAKQQEGEAIARAAEDKYIADYLENEGIRLDRTKISKNPGRRSIAKLMLNSFYGKFAQRPNLPKTKIVYSYREYMEIFNNPKYEIVGEHDTGLDSLIINYIMRNEKDAKPGNTSIAIASFVTAYARLKLFDLMMAVEYKLPKHPSLQRPRTLYFDTDSIIFIAHKDDPEGETDPVRTGDYLGQLTDEIKDGYGPTAICKRAAFLGPKNYAYEIGFTDKSDKKTVVKCKGITLYSSDLNVFKEFESVLGMAKKSHDTRQHQSATFQQSGIRANVHTHEIMTTWFEKTISSNMNKRSYKPALGWSLPIGFQVKSTIEEFNAAVTPPTPDYPLWFLYNNIYDPKYYEINSLIQREYDI